MCTYCGCESISVIGRYSSEHEAIVNAAGLLRRAASAGDLTAVRTAANAVSVLLGPHTRSEERSLFAELRLDPEFRDHIDLLCGEHEAIDASLTRVASGDLGAAESLFTLLRRHIDKEDNGLFPAAATALDGPAWERVAALA